MIITLITYLLTYLHPEQSADLKLALGLFSFVKFVEVTCLHRDETRGFIKGGSIDLIFINPCPSLGFLFFKFPFQQQQSI